MRIIKALLVGFTVLFIIITLFSLLIPSKVRVSRVVVINNVLAGDISPQIVNFENWKKWHPVFTIDSAKLQCKPAVNGEGPECIITNRGKDIEIRLLSADPAAIKFLLQSRGENDIENDIVITPLPAQKSVQVEWKAINKLHWYPWQKFYGIFIDKLTGPGYEAALNGLKEYVEKSSLSPGTAYKPS